MTKRARSPRVLLRELVDLHVQFTPDSARRKRELVELLARARLGSAREVERLHETLLFLRAYCDDALLQAAVERALEGFAVRRDLRAHARELADSGIAGTQIYYRFFEPTARRLATTHPTRLHIDWPEFEHADLLERLLPLLLPYAESPALDEADLTLREWIERARSPEETDATFLIRRFAALPLDEFARERLYEEVDLPLRLAPGPGTPSRTLACAHAVPLAFQTRALRRERPDLATAVLRRPRSIRAVPEREAAALIELVRDAMVVRSRDLDAFAQADPRDVRIADCGDGLAFVVYGVRPERRLVLEGVYACLTLKHGVPIGYVLASALFGSSEIAYNVFDTFRGGEAGHVYGAVLGLVHALFGVDTFTVYPYQLGHENDEGLRSGAWWFYQKLGFRPRERETLRLMRRELASMARDPTHRSDRATLKELARENVYWSLGSSSKAARERDDVIGIFPIGAVGLAVTDHLARNFGSERERGIEECAELAGRWLGLRRWRKLPPGERLAWERWSPLVCALGGVERWPLADRRALAGVIRAKGGRRESEFVRRFDAHVGLRRALCRIGGVRSSK